MTDDVKAAIERFREWEFDGLDARDHGTLLAHLDAEPARLAAAREEQAAESDRAFHAALVGDSSYVASLTATPLADALRDEREVSQSLREQLIAAEAERDALRAAVATADEAVRYWTEQAQAGANEAAELRAQVARGRMPAATSVNLAPKP